MCPFSTWLNTGGRRIKEERKKKHGRWMKIDDSGCQAEQRGRHKEMAERCAVCVLRSVWRWAILPSTIHRTQTIHILCNLLAHIACTVKTKDHLFGAANQSPVRTCAERSRKDWGCCRCRCVRLSNNMKYGNGRGILHSWNYGDDDGVYSTRKMTGVFFLCAPA